MLKNKLKILIAVAIIAVIIQVIFSLCFSNQLTENKTVTIAQGLSTMQIADLLKENNVISSKIVFFVSANLSEYKGKLKYGTFEFTPDDSYRKIIKKIATEGQKRKTVTVTIPEGYSVEKIIQKLASLGLGNTNSLKAALNDDYDFEFLKKIDVPKECFYKLEGFLFPSTYEFYEDASEHDIFKTMLSEFQKQYQSLNVPYDNLFNTIIKASVIEREAKLDTEREKIAGVIENRLKQNMLLQVDATVIYAISKGTYDIERVLYKDLQINSPYNTYKYKGIPIGPISNPGLKSIKAALNPEVHNYLYYRTDEDKNDGSHIFTETFSEHKQANN